MTDTQASRSPLPLFYRRPRPLLAERDGALAVRQGQGFGFAAEANAAPLVAAELPLACKDYPILFTEGPAPQMVALLGLRSGENLFVGDDGAWEAGTYIPAYVRRYPFIFLQSDDKSTYTLCIDEDATGSAAGEGGRLFEQGEPTELTRHALEFCRDFQGGLNATDAFLAALAEADLLVENRADVTLKDGQRFSLSGFRIIDEARFNALPDAVFLDWRAKGWLHLVYCHFISTGNWGALVDRMASESGPPGRGRA